MSLNDAIRYREQNLSVDGVYVAEIVNRGVATPFYLYSAQRILRNYDRIRSAFRDFDAHIHYSAKANANLSVLKLLINAGAGIDVVSGGEIFKALAAGASPERIVYAGVGKTAAEIKYALQSGVRWFNVENLDELAILQQHVSQYTTSNVNIALRLNPDVTANTHPYIATGHGGAKFGLTADVIGHILQNQDLFPDLNFTGIHVHIGSQLGDTVATEKAVKTVLKLIEPYPQIRTINIGGGIPNRYSETSNIPSVEDFASTLFPLLKDFRVFLEPGRFIVADACILVMRILYHKQQAGQNILIVDGSMTEMMRPALYQASHEILPIIVPDKSDVSSVQVVGPVCETTDVLGKDVTLPIMTPGDLIAMLDVGAYGSVMANNYNARTRPAEVMVRPDGSWQIIRERETWRELIKLENIIEI